MFAFFERLVAPFPDKDATQPPQGLIAFCRHYTQGCERYLVLMALLSAAIAIAEVTLFGFLGDLVDWLVDQSPETLFADEWPTLLVMSFVVLILLPGLVLLHGLIVHQTLLGNYPMAIRWLSHKYLLKQSVSFYSDDFAGRIATKMLQTSLSIREAVMKLLDVLVFVGVYFFAIVAVVAYADWRLMLPLLVWFGAYIAIQCYFVPKLKQISSEQADARSVMTGRIVDSYTNIQTVKLFAHTQREEDYAEESMSGFMDTVYRQMRWVTALNFSVQFINYALAFSVAALSLWLWTHNAISVGVIAVAVSLSLRINGMAQWIMWEVGAVFEHIGTIIDGISTLSKPQEVVDHGTADPLAVTQGAVEFRNVSFHYGKASGVMSDLNLAIKPGEKIGVVGRSGAGKSTLVNLLLRFYDLESGSILIDGQDIRLVSQESLRQNIGMVTQDTSLLHRSVRENILYGRPDATQAELLNAVTRAQAWEFIEELTDPKGNSGFDAQVGERGVKLSGGQRQRIAIARVLLKDAPILILDEATSALDSEVEAAIQESLYQLMEGKTVIAIAHRLSTIAAMDRLIVMEDGHIVEQGSHHELVAHGGIYAKLWAHQTGGFLGID